jgi:hypothetical protein
MDGPDEELIAYLERDQLVQDTTRPLPRMSLSRRARCALWGLRGFVILASAMVVYVFVSQL